VSGNGLKVVVLGHLLQAQTGDDKGDPTAKDSNQRTALSLHSESPFPIADHNVVVFDGGSPYQIGGSPDGYPEQAPIPGSDVRIATDPGEILHDCPSILAAKR
jgi:hypothetical protein